MEGHQQRGFSLPSTWLELNVTTLDYLIAVTVFLGAVSLFSAVSGEPETMALVAVAGITVVLLGTTFIRLSEHLRTNGMSLP